MTKYYVKVEKGVIVEGPSPLSSSESVSPNSNWSGDQLRLNNIFIVDLSHDTLTEKIDFSDPKINLDGVEYPRIPLSSQESIDQQNIEILKKRASEYPAIEDLIVALWERIYEGKTDYADQLQAKRQIIKEKYPKATL